MLPRDISQPDGPDFAPLRALLDEVSCFELAPYESLSAQELRATLVPHVQALLQRSLLAVEAIVALDRGAGPEWEAVLDLAFLAELELSQGRALLAEASLGGGVVELLSQCDSAVTRAAESLRALGTLGRVVEPSAISRELGYGLALRRVYAKFRRDVLAIEVGGDDLFRRMRRAGTRIAMLVGDPTFPRARVRDRFLIRALQTRMLGWLRSAEPRCERTARALLSDLATFARMLSLVNLRQELRAHDALILARIHTIYLPPRAELDALRGLDDELDELIACADGCESPRLRERLRELAAERHVVREHDAQPCARATRA